MIGLTKQQAHHLKCVIRRAVKKRKQVEPLYFGQERSRAGWKRRLAKRLKSRSIY